MNEYPKKSKEFLLLILSGIFFAISFDKVQSASVSATVRISVCGNQIAEYGENCDNSDLKGKSCKSLGYDSGALTCHADCSFDVRECKNGSEEDNGGGNESTQQQTSAESGSNSQTSEQMPTTVVGKIEEENEMRTLEVNENNSTSMPASSVSQFGKDEIEISITDTEGNSAVLVVATENNSFAIRQGEVTAFSQYSVIVDKDAGKIFVIGPEGKTELKILPGIISEKTKKIDGRYKIEKIQIENDDNALVYSVSVTKEQKFLGILSVKIPSILKYSVQDGILVRTEKNLFWKIVDFFSF